MKKIFIGLTVLAGFVTTMAFAQSADPNPSVLHAFQTDFKEATNVEWQERPDFAKVHFNFNGSQVEAFYQLDGQLIGTARTIVFDQLPLAAVKAIQTRFPEATYYNITEYSKDGELFYMLTVEHRSKKLSVRLSSTGELTVEKKTSL